MNVRVVDPELLDGLPPAEAAARRSRRDLRWINFLMGNERWIMRSLRTEGGLVSGCAEWGAGTGELTAKIARAHPQARVMACDLLPPPPGLPSNVEWRQGDLLQGAEPLAGGVLVMNLFLHHFEGAALAALAARCLTFDALVINEPLRARWPHLLGWLLWPLINEVTRHDLHVSLRAGFAPGELPALLRLDGRGWQWHEQISWRGALRLKAWKT